MSVFFVRINFYIKQLLFTVVMVNKRSFNYLSKKSVALFKNPSGKNIHNMAD